MVAIAPEELEEARAKRRRVLLEKWAAGKASQKEIEELGIEPPETFTLEAESAYKRPAVEYAERFGISIPSVYRHRTAGAPFDEPAELPEWWTKTHPRRRLPEWVQRAAVEATPPPGEEVGGFELAEFSGDDEGGAALTVAQARAICELEFSRLQDAYRANDDGRIAALQSSWQKAAEQFRKAETSARSASAQKDEIRASYTEELTALLASLAEGVRTLPARIARMLGAEPTPEQRARFESEVESLFRRLREFAGAEKAEDAA